MGILDRLTARPRAESTTARDPASWFLDALWGPPTASGVRVSEAVAMRLSPYYCGVNMIAGTLGSLPCNVYKRGEGRSREVWDVHPVHRLLHDEPNPEMTAMSSRQTWVMHAIARGNSYAEIERDGDGNPRYLWPLLPTMTKPRRDEEGRLWYQVSLESGEHRFLRREDVLHVPGLGGDGIVGYGLIQVACECIGLNTAQDQYASRFFRNGGNISGVVETPGVLKDETFNRLKKEIAEKFSGLTNAHRIAILEAGIKFNAINPTHEESQLIESRRFSVEEWARWLNMPPHKLKELSKSTFSNIEHQNIEWVVDTIRPWAVRFEQEWNRKLFRNRNLFYTKHVVDGLLRGDQKARYDAYALGRTWGWLSANDVLELEDRNPLPGNIGDIYLTPLNMGRADQATGPEQAAAERLVRQESRALAAKGAAGTYDEAFNRRVTEWLGVPAATAARYAAVAAQLNLIAADQGVDPGTLQAAKVALLVQLARGGQLDA